jgi:hypothetical protein
MVEPLGPHGHTCPEVVSGLIELGQPAVEYAVQEVYIGLHWGRVRDYTHGLQMRQP